MDRARSNARGGWENRRCCTNMLSQTEKSMTDDELESLGAFFFSLPKKSGTSAKAPLIAPGAPVKVGTPAFPHPQPAGVIYRGGISFSNKLTMAFLYQLSQEPSSFLLCVLMSQRHSSVCVCFSIGATRTELQPPELQSRKKEELKTFHPINLQH